MKFNTFCDILWIFRQCWTPTFFSQNEFFSSGMEEGCGCLVWSSEAEFAHLVPYETQNIKFLGRNFDASGKLLPEPTLNSSLLVDLCCTQQPNYFGGYLKVFFFFVHQQSLSKLGELKLCFRIHCIENAFVFRTHIMFVFFILP